MMGVVTWRGERVDRWRTVEPVSKKPVTAMANRRSGIERRQKDGLGLFPRATTPKEHYRRWRYNQILSILLILGGSMTALATLALILMQRTLLSSFWPCPVLGLVLVIAGIGFAQRPERRREDRRHP